MIVSGTYKLFLFPLPEFTFNYNKFHPQCVYVTPGAGCILFSSNINIESREDCS